MDAIPGKIFAKIAAVMRKVEAIDKNRKNPQQGFMFRGIDEVYNALHFILAEEGVFTVPEVLDFSREERPTKSGGVSTWTVAKVKFTFYCEDGSSVQAVTIGEGMDSGDKSASKSMAIAHKYALLQVLCIPTKEQKDPDGESHDPKPKQGTAKPAQTPPQGSNSSETAKDGPITEPQRKRLFAGAKDFGWSPDDIKAYLGIDHNIQSTKDIPKSKYDAICEYISKNPINPTKK